MHAHRVTIIIPTYNRLREIDICLNALVPQLEKHRDVEAIVCDDSSTDQTMKLVAGKYPQVQCHPGPKRGPAANRNFGAAKASGEWLAFLDDDCVPSTDYLSSYLDEMSQTTDDNTALEGPTIRPDPPSLLWEAPHNPEGGILISCNFAIRHRQFFDLGGFSERYPCAAFEDTEFAARLRASGGNVRFVKAASVIHPLRPVPCASKLASRWEGKVVISLDYGAPPLYIMARLPWHSLRVIQSRFRDKPLSCENFAAAFRFARELLFVLIRTPGWVRRHSITPRSDFWARQFQNRRHIPKYGF